MDGAMGLEEDVVEAVLTCEGNFHDPELNSRIERFRHRLKDLLLTEKHKLNVKKVEPWNSVKVTFTIPKDAAIRLRQLAQSGNDALRQMGVHSVQIQGDTQISLSIAAEHKSESTELVLQMPPAMQTSSTSLPLDMPSTEITNPNSEGVGPSPTLAKDELTRKNIMNYFRHGSALRHNAALFDTILGSGASYVSTQEMNLGVTQSSNSSGSNTCCRVNNIDTAPLQNQTLGGSQINSNFPFTKTLGAFHTPVPRLHSAGQSSVTNTTQLTQSGNTSCSRVIGSLAQDTMDSLSQLSNAWSFTQGSPQTLSIVSSVGSLRPSTSSSTNFSHQFFHVPPSSSPTSSFMNLPPPPPYPHKPSSIPQLGKPVTASSPLLINLLQTDPLAAAALLSSEIPNKSLSSRDKSSGSPLKKRRRSKDATDGLVKPYLLNDSACSSKIDFYHNLLGSNSGSQNDTVSYSEHSVSDSANDLFSVDLVHHRASDLVSHMQDFFISGFHTGSKPLLSPDSSPVENSASNILQGGFHSDSNRSAIRTGCSSSKLSDPNGQKTFTSDLDPFSMEIAAGKIINSYTGQLEHRDSIEDSGQIRIKDLINISQGDSFTTQILTNKAKGLDEIYKYTVPSYASVHVSRPAIPNQFSVSTCTAAISHSDEPAQMPSSKSKSVFNQHNCLVSSVPVSRNNLSSNIYAVSGKPWQELVCSTDVELECLSSAVTKFTPMKLSTSVSSMHQKVPFPSTLHNGPVIGGPLMKRNLNLLQQQPVVTSAFTSGSLPEFSESVIYSNIKLPSSLSLPVFHQMHVAHSHHTVTPSAAIHMSTPMMLQNSTSSSLPLTSWLDSSFAPSHLSVVQAAERMKTSGSIHLSSNQQNQAASSNNIEDCITPKLSSPNLLNSLSDKHIDSQSSIESPIDNKVSSEGDENSNHSGLIIDTLPEQLGTTALLEHSSVKTENHDSGVGSSSERSDDTPSESGDSEFRSGQIISENEDIGKNLSQKTVNCKMTSKTNSISNTIMVGYMVNTSDCTSQPQLEQINSSNHVMLSPASSSSKVFHTHTQSLDKQTVHLAGRARISCAVRTVEEGKGHSCLNYTGNLRDYGPSADDMGISSSVTMNGPSHCGNTEIITIASGEEQHKKTKILCKDKRNKGMMQVQTEHLELQRDVLEKMSKIHHLLELAKDTSHVLTTAYSVEKFESSDTLTERLKGSDDKPAQLIFDMEELINGKTLGCGSYSVDGKGGSNITSIYSKRSSVNVNMLNHMYAPGLPLPRRLTESVQRLVKPLPTSETSATVSQFRLCKSPASSGSPKSSYNNLSSLRASVQSGVRSPGSSAPKFGSSDRQSLLSGSLDLAGLSNSCCAHTGNVDHARSPTAIVSCKTGSPVLTQDILHQDSHFLSNQNSSPNSNLDIIKLYSGKKLSKSFPPHKFKDPTLTVSSSSMEKSNHLLSSQTIQYNAFSKTETSSSQNNFFLMSDKPHHNSIHSNHMSSEVVSTNQTMQAFTSAESTHSRCNNKAVDNSNVYTSHSSAPSPVMPVLQEGQELQTPTLSFSIPSVSSHPIFCTAIVNSTICTGSSVPLSCATVSAQNKHVPYSNSLVNISGLTVSATAKTTVGTTDSPSLSSPLSTFTSISSPPKSKNIYVSNNLSLLSPRSGSYIPHFDRNLFESVSETLNCDNITERIFDHPTWSDSVEQVVHGHPHLTSYNSQIDSLSSALVSKNSHKDSLLVKNMRHKSADGGETETAGSVSYSGNTDKLVTTSKPVHAALELSHFNSVSAQNVDLYCSKTPQTCDFNYLNKESTNNTNCGKGAVKTDLSNSHILQESDNLQLTHSFTLSLSSIDDTVACLPYSVEAVDNIIAPAVPVMDSTSKVHPTLSTCSVSVKQSVLETLSSTLESMDIKTSQVSLVKSCIHRESLTLGLNSELHQREEDFINKSKLVTSQACQQRPQSCNNIETRVETVTSALVAQNTETFKERQKMKRTCTHNEEEGDTSSRESSPVKQLQLVHITSSMKSTTRSPTLMTAQTKLDDGSISDSDDIKEWYEENTSGHLKINVTESQEKDKEYNCHRKNSSQEEIVKNVSRNCKISSSQNSEQVDAQENRLCRSATLCTDDSQLNKSSSVNRGLPYKERRSHCNSDIFEDGTKEGQAYHMNNLVLMDKDLVSDSHYDKTQSVDYIENSHNALHSVTNTHNDDDSYEKRHSTGDKDNIRFLNDVSAEKTGIPEKDYSEFEDVLKKSQRLKRQFYTYVPEKSIDQTYFDTPILSGRTRSKNKPNDLLMEDAVLAQDRSALAANTVESYSHYSVVEQLRIMGKLGGSDDGVDMKRPTRTIRPRDNVQDNSTSKRRRLQNR